MIQIVDQMISMYIWSFIVESSSSNSNPIVEA